MTIPAFFIGFDPTLISPEGQAVLCQIKPDSSSKAKQNNRRIMMIKMPSQALPALKRKNSHCDGYSRACLDRLGRPGLPAPVTNRVLSLSGATTPRTARSLIGNTAGLGGITIGLSGKTGILGRRATGKTRWRTVWKTRWRAERNAGWVAVRVAGLLAPLLCIAPYHEFGVFPPTLSQFPRHFSTSLQ